MKKIIALLLVLAMALSLVACGGASKPAETEAPKAEAAAPEAPAAEAKKYDGVELTYWAMWNEAEPRARLSPKLLLLSRQRPALRSMSSSRAVT